MGATYRLPIMGALCGILCFAAAGVCGEHLWTFDEGQGTLAGDSLGDLSGSVRGAQWVAGQRGSALQFDGADDYVALPDNDPVWLPDCDFTVAFWVYFDRGVGSSVPDSEVLVDLNHGASGDPSNELGTNIQRRGDTGRIAFQMTTIRNPDDDLYSRTIPAKGKWHHITAVRQGTLQKIYIDGELDAYRACSSSPVDFTGGYDDDKVNVARYTAAIGEPRYHFQGKLDELMILDRALSPAEIRQLFQGDMPANHLYVDAAKGSDASRGRSPHAPLATIRKAISLARNGDVINVYPGVYQEEIYFAGKAITVQSIGDAAILQAPDRFAVSFYMGEGPDTVLRNFVIANSYIGIFSSHSSPTITNVTVTGNVYGLEAYGRALPRVGNSIFWGNAESDLYGCQPTYSCVERNDNGQGNFSDDPLLVDPENGDYHVRSARGRYWPEHDMWVLDEVTSPCVDAGDPAADFSSEPLPNGGRLNLGAYGGTAYAEMSEAPLTGDVNGDGVFDENDYALFMGLWEQRNKPQPPVTPGRRR